MSGLNLLQTASNATGSGLLGSLGPLGALYGGARFLQDALNPDKGKVVIYSDAAPPLNLKNMADYESIIPDADYQRLVSSGMDQTSANRHINNLFAGQEDTFIRTDPANVRAILGQPGAPTESSGGEGGGGGGGGRGSLQLDRYTGNTQVPLTPELQQTIDLITQMITDPNSNYRSLLSGKPDYGQLERGVLTPARRELLEQIIPSIGEAYSGGPYGGGYNTGARRDAQMGAANEFAETSAKVRADEAGKAKDRSMQAMSMLPSFAGIQDIELQNDIANKEREIATHYANQGLTAQEFQADMQEMEMALKRSGLNLQSAMFEWQQSQANLNRQDQLNAISRSEDLANWSLAGNALGQVAQLAGYNEGGQYTDLFTAGAQFAGGYSVPAWQTVLNSGSFDFSSLWED